LERTGNSGKTILENGVRIVTKRIPYVRSVSMGVWVNVGARDETAAENGLSHFIEHMIFKGTCKRSAFQIAKEFDMIGGQTNAFTTMENTCYYAKVIDTHLKAMVDILSDIFLNSVFDAEEVEKERPVIFQEIGMIEDNPEDYIHVLSSSAYWGDDGLGRSILGTRENIFGFDAETIKKFFQKNYRPERIIISAAGNLEHSHFVDLVGPAFEAIRTGEGFSARIVPAGRSIVDIHPRKIEQVHLCLMTGGMSLTDPRRYALSLLNTILGGNMSSRLFQEIRERRGLAYSVYSFFSSFMDTGIFGVYTGVESKNARLAVDLILRGMMRLKAEPVNADELDDAKEYTKGSLMLAAESVDNQMVRIAQNEANFGEYIPLKAVIEGVDAVTPDNLVHLAEDLFRTDRVALVLLGPIKNKEAFESVLSLQN